MEYIVIPCLEKKMGSGMLGSQKSDISISEK
jgi:hypothetical protein